MNYKFLDLFEPIQKGDYGLTEEAVYKSIQLGNELIPLWGGNADHTATDRFVDIRALTIRDKPITIFDDEGIIISLDGSAGHMTYKKHGPFALNHHAGFIRRLEDTSDVVDLEFFSIFFEEFLKEASVSSGSKTLSLEMIYTLEFDLPVFTAQLDAMSKIRKILEQQRKIQHLLQRIEKLNSRGLTIDASDIKG